MADLEDIDKSDLIKFDIPDVDAPQLLPIASTLAPVVKVVKKYVTVKGDVFVEYFYRCTLPVETNTNGEIPAGIHVYEKCNDPYMIVAMKI